ncbi:ABC transporter permease [Photobacterium damselae]|nr:ABC transporter permease [Photobacterium damselae]
MKLQWIKLIGLILGLMAGAIIVPYFIPSIDLHLTERLQSPSLTYWFGTDWLGRDVFLRSVQALACSVRVGLSSALFTGLFALFLAVLGNSSHGLYQTVRWAIDTFLALPHILLLILLTLCFGSDANAIIWAVTLSHWPRLTQLLLQEMKTIGRSRYVLHAEQFGSSRFMALCKHGFPYISAQWVIGLILLFPHILMHIAALTFLGFGLEPSQPTLGGMLSESNRYLMLGYWWLGLLPGVLLILIVLILAKAGRVMTQQVTHYAND